MPNVEIDINEELSGFTMEEGTLSSMGFDPKIKANDIPKFKNEEDRKREKSNIK